MLFNTQSAVGYQLCSSSCRRVPGFEGGKLHTGASQENENKVVRSFNLICHYIDNVFPLNNSKSGNFIDRIYSIDLEINDITDTAMFAS